MMEDNISKIPIYLSRNIFALAYVQCKIEKVSEVGLFCYLSQVFLNKIF